MYKKILNWARAIVPLAALLGIVIFAFDLLAKTALKIGKTGPLLLSMSILTVVIALALAFAINGGINVLQMVYDELTGANDLAGELTPRGRDHIRASK